MDNFKIKLSGIKPITSKIEVPVITSFDPEGDLIDLIVDGRDHVKSHFHNAVFSSEDLLKILNDDNEPDVERTDIMFSHVAARKVNSSDMISTVTAIGTGKISRAGGSIEYKFLYGEDKMFVSNDTNITIKNIDNYIIDLNKDLTLIHNNIQPKGSTPHMIPKSTSKINWYKNTPPDKTMLGTWLNGFSTTIDMVRKAGTLTIFPPSSNIPRPLTHGVFFNEKKITSLLTNSKYVILFPVTIMVKWKLNFGSDWTFPIVSYLIAPIEKKNDGYYIPITLGIDNSLDFIVSDTTWPARWEKT